MTDRQDDRSTIAQAVAWSSRITAVSLEMVLPAAIGYWIDQKLGTSVLFLVIGLVFGSTAGMIHLLRMVAEPEEDRRQGDGAGED